MKTVDICWCDFTSSFSKTNLLTCLAVPFLQVTNQRGNLSDNKTTAFIPLVKT